MKKFTSALLVLFFILSISIIGAYATETDDFEYEILEDNTIAITDYKKDAKTIVIPSEIDGHTVTVIGSWSFSGCYDTVNITIPDTITEIGDFAFYNCHKLTAINIPASVKKIGGFVFSDCGDLSSLVVDKNNLFLDSRNNCNAIIETKTNTLLVACASTVIPDTVTTIKQSSFYHIDVKKINIPKSVTNIESNAFVACPFVTSVTVDSENPVYDSRNNCNAIIETATNKLICAFEITEIPKTVTSIAPFAFYECSSEKLYINENISNIEENAFFHGFFEKIVVDKNNPVYDSRENCNSVIETKTNTLIASSDNSFIPNGVEIIGDYAMSGFNNNIEIPDTVTKIGKEAFSWSTFTKINIPDSVKFIGEKAFEGCYELTDVKLSNSLTEIGTSVFADSAIKEITIPASVKSIGEDAFDGCNNLKKIKILNSKCTFFDEWCIPEETTIYGYDGSTAEKFAKQYNRPFVSLGKATDKNNDSKPDAATPSQSSTSNQTSQSSSHAIQTGANTYAVVMIIMAAGLVLFVTASFLKKKTN